MVDKLYLIKFKKIEIIYSENQIRRWSSQDMILGKFNTLSIRIFPRWDVDDRFSIIRKGKITRDALESSVATRIDREAVHFIDPSCDARTSSLWRRSWRRCTENLLLILFIFSQNVSTILRVKTILNV